MHNKLFKLILLFFLEGILFDIRKNHRKEDIKNKKGIDITLINNQYFQQNTNYGIILILEYENNQHRCDNKNIETIQCHFIYIFCT